MFLSIQSGNQIKKSIQYPMKQEEQFDLLFEVDHLMTDQPFPVGLQCADPNENKKLKSRIVFEDLSSRVNYKWKHTARTETTIVKFHQPAADFKKQF
jgi:hypothetical protein